MKRSKLFQIGQTMGLRQGIGLSALLAVLTQLTQVTQGEDYDNSSRSEEHLQNYISHNQHYHRLPVEQEPVQLHI